MKGKRERRRLSGSVRRRRGRRRGMRRWEERVAVTPAVFCTGFSSEECSAGGRYGGSLGGWLTLEYGERCGDGVGGVGEEAGVVTRVLLEATQD